jgi:hypothetical protein
MKRLSLCAIFLMLSLIVMTPLYAESNKAKNNKKSPKKQRSYKTFVVQYEKAPEKFDDRFKLPLSFKSVNVRESRSAYVKYAQDHVQIGLTF